MTLGKINKYLRPLLLVTFTSFRWLWFCCILSIMGNPVTLRYRFVGCPNIERKMVDIQRHIWLQFYPEINAGSHIFSLSKIRANNLEPGVHSLLLRVGLPDWPGSCPSECDISAGAGRPGPGAGPPLKSVGDLKISVKGYNIL